MKLFRALTIQPFRLLWSGQTISRLGDSLYQIALAWWVLEKTHSAAAMGTVLTLSFLPMIVFLFIGGVAVDRLPRIKVMLMADVVRGVLVGGITALAWTQALELWHIYAFSLLFGLVNAFFQPAYTATVPQITPRELLPSANALTDLGAQLASVIGPAVGALLVAMGGTPLAFGIDALSFVISAGLLAPLLHVTMLARSAVKSVRPRAISILHSARGGVTIVIGTSWLWITIVILALVNLTGHSPMNVALPFLVKDKLGTGVESLGLVLSAFSAGAVLGAVCVGQVLRRRWRGRVIYVGLAIVGGLTVAIGLMPTLAGTAFAVLALGGVLSVVNLTWVNVLQEHVPNEFFGRVSAVNALGSNVLLPIGFGLAGWASDALGAPIVFVIGGALTLGLALIGLTQSSIHSLD